jgi:hypothetical protein
MRKKIIALLTLGLMTAGSINASIDEPQGVKTRPKVAVVLSGGGAKGMAHI